jgi:hypothetical protein
MSACPSMSTACPFLPIVVPKASPPDADPKRYAIFSGDQYDRETWTCFAIKPAGRRAQSMPGLNEASRKRLDILLSYEVEIDAAEPRLDFVRHAAELESVMDDHSPLVLVVPYLSDSDLVDRLSIVQFNNIFGSGRVSILRARTASPLLSAAVLSSSEAWNKVSRIFNSGKTVKKFCIPPGCASVGIAALPMRFWDIWANKDSAFSMRTQEECRNITAIPRHKRTREPPARDGEADSPSKRAVALRQAAAFGARCARPSAATPSSAFGPEAAAAAHGVDEPPSAVRPPGPPPPSGLAALAPRQLLHRQLRQEDDEATEPEQIPGAGGAAEPPLATHGPPSPRQLPQQRPLRGSNLQVSDVAATAGPSLYGGTADMHNLMRRLLGSGSAGQPPSPRPGCIVSQPLRGSGSARQLNQPRDETRCTVHSFLNNRPLCTADELSPEEPEDGRPASAAMRADGHGDRRHGKHRDTAAATGARCPEPTSGLAPLGPRQLLQGTRSAGTASVRPRAEPAGRGEGGSPSTQGRAVPSEATAAAKSTPLADYVRDIELSNHDFERRVAELTEQRAALMAEKEAAQAQLRTSQEAEGALRRELADTRTRLAEQARTLSQMAETLARLAGTRT